LVKRIEKGEPIRFAVRIRMVDLVSNGRIVLSYRKGNGMPVTRSEAMFFLGGVAAGVAAFAAYPYVKKHLEGLSGSSAEGLGGQNSEIGQKLAETVEQFVSKTPSMAEASASGMAAGVAAAKRMAEAVKKAAGEGAETILKPGQQAA
jgi:hypothetical protein